MNQGKIVVLSGPSGSGKTTLTKRIVLEIPNLYFSVSATTRKRREGEEEGKSYYFFQKEEFLRRVKRNEFIEYEEVWGNYYGTIKEKTNAILNKGKNLIFDIEVHGGMSIKNVYNERALLIFIAPPSMKELESRLYNRKTETKGVVKERLQRSGYEFSFAPKYDCVFTNKDLDSTVIEIKKTIINFIK